MNKLLNKIIFYFFIGIGLSVFIFVLIFSITKLEDKKSTVTIQEDQYILNILADNYEKILLQKRENLEKERLLLLNQKKEKDLTKEQLEIEEKLKEIKDKKEEINQKINDFQKEKNKMEMDIKDLKDQINEKNKLIGDLQAANYNLNIKLEQESKSLEEYVNFIKNSIIDIYKNNEKKIKEINFEFYRSNGRFFIVNEIKSLNNDLANLNKEVNNLNNLITKLKEEKSSSNIINIENENTIKELKNKIKELESIVEKFKNNNLKVISYLNNKNEKNINNLEDSDFFIEIYNKMYNIIEKNKKDIGELEDLIARNKKKEQEREQIIQKSINLLSSKNIKPEKGMVIEEFFYNTFLKLFKDLDEKSIVIEDSENKSLKDKIITELNNKIVEKDNEIQNLNKKISDLNNEINTKNNRISNLEKELENKNLVKSDDSDKQKQINDLMNKINVLNNEKDILNSNLQELKDKLEKLEKGNKKITEYLETKNEKYNIAQFITDFFYNTFKKLYDLMQQKDNEIVKLQQEQKSNTKEKVKEVINNEQIDKLTLEKNEILNQNNELNEQIKILKQKIEKLQKQENNVINFLLSKNENKINNDISNDVFFINTYVKLYNEIEITKQKLTDTIKNFKKDFDNYKEKVAKRESLLNKEKEYLFNLSNINGIFSDDDGKVYAVISKTKESEILKNEVFFVYDKNKQVVSKIQISKNKSDYIIKKFPGYSLPASGCWF